MQLLSSDSNYYHMYEAVCIRVFHACMLFLFTVTNPVSSTNIEREAFPADIHITSVQMTSIDLDWEDWTFHRYPNQTISGYYVRVCTTTTCKLYDLHDSPSSTFKATNLKPATQYSVSVAAVTKKSIKPYSPSVQVTTLPRGVCMHVFVCGHEISVYLLYYKAYLYIFMF